MRINMEPRENQSKKPKEPIAIDDQEEAKRAAEREKINAQLIALGNPKGKATKKNIISGIVLLVMMIIMVLSVMLSTSEIEEIAYTIGQIGQGNNYVWLLGGFAAAIVFFAIYPLSLLILSRSYDKSSSKSDAYLIGAGEHFFNGVTPFAAGGQPIQIYDFAKKGMNPGMATGLVLTNFMLYLIVLNIYELLAFIYWPDINQAMVSYCTEAATGDFNGAMYWGFIGVAIMGYVFNLGFLAFIIALGCSKKLAAWLVKVAKWLCKWNLLGKILGPKIPKFENYCENVQSTIRGVFKHKKSVALAFLIKALVYGIYFSLPYFIINAVGQQLGPGKIFETMMVTSFASGAMCWMPTPGGTGGIEFAFAIAVGAVLPEVESLSAIGNTISLLWRLLTFYFVLLLSLVAVIVFESGFQIKLKKDVAKGEERKKELLHKLEQLEAKSPQTEGKIPSESSEVSTPERNKETLQKEPKTDEEEKAE